MSEQVVHIDTASKVNKFGEENYSVTREPVYDSIFNTLS
jgi:hypothetical protein